MAKNPALSIRLCPTDPTLQEWRVGDGRPFRLTAEQALQVIALSRRLIGEQERHLAGGRIVLPMQSARPS